jgi:hypothetical protein
MSDALEHINAKLLEDQELLQVQLGKGAAKDYAEYMSMVGTIRGLTKARMLIAEMAERMAHSDE